MKLLKTFALAAACVAMLPALPVVSTAQAQTFPTKPVTLVVPFPPGGPTDAMARTLAAEIKDHLGQPMIVENRAGAGGNIGADVVAKSNPDGYTLLMGTTGVLAINNYLYKDMPFDPQRDFAPVSYTSLITNILVVNANVPAKNVADLVALAKAKPGELTFASSGAGSSTHLSAELFKSMAGVDIVHVPYKGSSQAITDLMAGHVTMLVDNAPSSLPYVQQGKLRALAVTSLKRMPGLPDVPTLDEAGVKGYESLSWSGIVAPAATPKPVIAKLNAAIERVLAMPDVRKKFADLGVDPVGGPPEAFARHIRAESEKWGRVVKAANITLN